MWCYDDIIIWSKSNKRFVLIFYHTCRIIVNCAVGIQSKPPTRILRSIMVKIVSTLSKGQCKPILSVPTYPIFSNHFAHVCGSCMVQVLCPSNFVARYCRLRAIQLITRTHRTGANHQRKQLYQTHLSRELTRTKTYISVDRPSMCVSYTLMCLLFVLSPLNDVEKRYVTVVNPFKRKHLFAYLAAQRVETIFFYLLGWMSF